MTLFGDMRPRQRRPRDGYGAAQAAVMAAIAEACKAQNVPPLDRGQRSIVVQMARNLLVGGWPLDEIRHVAVELALKYDRFNGHRSLLGLQGVMEIADEARQERAHEAFEKDEAGVIEPRVAAILGKAAKRDERRLPGNHKPQGDPCTICEGPPGVHVKSLNIPDLEREAMQRMARERALRQPMHRVGE